MLVGAQMPAVLVECGFLSNRDEAARLASAPYQQMLAHGIAEAVGPLFQRRRRRGKSVSEAPISASSEAASVAESAVARDEDALLRRVRSGARPGQAARAYLDAVREELAARHFAGAGGMEIVREYTGCVDRLVRALYRYAEHHHSRRFARLNQRLAVVARGGYGRGELNPQSDIDLLFLHDYKPGPYVEIVTEIILHALWDAGLTVGQAVRNVTRMRSRWPPTT